MDLCPNASSNAVGVLRRRARRTSATVAAVLAMSLLVVTTPSGAASHTLASQPGYPRIARAQFPVGVRDASEPSGAAPPLASSLPGYQRVYTTDFSGSALPSGWGTFAGVPSGDDQSRWLPSHVVVSGGVVRLIASKDAGGGWVTGGIGQFGVGRAYGAYFVRSRVTAPGPDEDEMLWPVAPVWPPEVDFNEMGNSGTSTSWTVHYGHGNTFVQTTRNFNMERWHTWGLIWTPTSMTFTIDGHPWGVLTRYAEIPHQKMTLDVQQQVWCQPDLACPTRATSLEVDWVAEFAKA
jgi:Glycosyl hydrolases family 16